MRKLIYTLGLLVLLVPTIVFAKQNPVNVYVYEAGGCPFCEQEIAYLKGLDSYNKKFKIVQKELYVDHINWAQGKDFTTGVKVASTFKAAGFTNAAYNATPFVVISDVYAATGYNTNLEEYINKAYEAGDKDIVKCIESGKDECIEGITPDKVEAAMKQDNTEDTTNNNDNKINTTSSGTTTNGTIVWVVIICTVVSNIIYLVKSTYDKKTLLEKK